jgi:hypothetical protein
VTVTVPADWLYDADTDCGGNTETVIAAADT